MKRGEKGPHVRQLQEELIALGYPLPRFGADGWLGEETFAAVRAFMRDRALPAQEIGDEILSALDAAYRDVKPPAPAIVPPQASGLSIVAGRLIASPESPYVVLYAPTRERSKRTGQIKQLICHHTNVKASERPLKDLAGLCKEAGHSPAEAAALLAQLGDGPIPSILSLALQGAGDWNNPDGRDSSWDFGIGDGPRDYLGGRVPIVQCNPHLEQHYCWGARGVNPEAVHIEMEYYGYLDRKGDRLFFDVDGPKGRAAPRDVTGRLPGGMTTFRGELCEQLHPQSRQALYDVARVLCHTYGIKREKIRGHNEVEPHRRYDPEPAYTAEEVRQAVYPL